MTVSNVTQPKEIWGYNGKTDGADSADGNGFWEDFLRKIRVFKVKNPFPSAESALSVFPLYPQIPLFCI